MVPGHRAVLFLHLVEIGAEMGEERLPRSNAGSLAPEYHIKGQFSVEEPPSVPEPQK